VLAVTAKDTETRAADIVGGVSSFIGVAANIILPLKIMGDQSWWQKHYARSRSDDPCALVNTAEMLLVRGAESEAFGVGPLVHVGNFIINIAGGLVLGLGYNRWPRSRTPASSASSSAKCRSRRSPPTPSKICASTAPASSTCDRAVRGLAWRWRRSSCATVAARRSRCVGDERGRALERGLQALLRKEDLCVSSFSSGRRLGADARRVRLLAFVA